MAASLSLETPETSGGPILAGASRRRLLELLRDLQHGQRQAGEQSRLERIAAYQADPGIAS